MWAACMMMDFYLLMSKLIGLTWRSSITPNAQLDRDQRGYLRTYCILLIWWSNLWCNKHNFGEFREKIILISGENVILTMSRNKHGVESNKQIRSIIDLPLRVILISSLKCHLWGHSWGTSGFHSNHCHYKESKTLENTGLWLDNIVFNGSIIREPESELFW